MKIIQNEKDEICTKGRMWKDLPACTLWESRVHGTKNVLMAKPLDDKIVITEIDADGNILISWHFRASPILYGNQFIVTEIESVQVETLKVIPK